MWPWASQFTSLGLSFVFVPFPLISFASALGFTIPHLNHIRIITILLELLLTEQGLCGMPYPKNFLYILLFHLPNNSMGWVYLFPFYRLRNWAQVNGRAGVWTCPHNSQFLCLFPRLPATRPGSPLATTIAFLTHRSNCDPLLLNDLEWLPIAWATQPGISGPSIYTQHTLPMSNTHNTVAWGFPKTHVSHSWVFLAVHLT